MTVCYILLLCICILNHEVPLFALQDVKTGLRFANPFNSTSFIVCLTGKAVVQPCAPGGAYDASTGSCKTSSTADNEARLCKDLADGIYARSDNGNGTYKVGLALKEPDFALGSCLSPGCSRVCAREWCLDPFELKTSSCNHACCV